MKIKLKVAMGDNVNQFGYLTVDDERITSKDIFIADFLAMISHGSSSSMPPIGVQRRGKFIELDNGVFINIDRISLVAFVEKE